MSTVGPLPANLQQSSTILLLTSAQTQQDDTACMDLLSITEPESEDVLSITVTQTASDRLERWQEHIGMLPAKAAIISTGEQISSTAADSSTSTHPPTGVHIETVQSPGDLTGIGIAATEQLQAFAQDENQIVICFHSLTSLLQYADLERVFRFLHVLITRLTSLDAVAHFHLDPSAHDQQTISTLIQLFDAVIEYDVDTGWQIQAR